MCAWSDKSRLVRGAMHAAGCGLHVGSGEAMIWPAGSCGQTGVVVSASYGVHGYLIL